jgi:hypothetical protein
MKKTNFMYASAIMMAFAFGMVSCEQSQDNPVPAEPTEPEVQYEEFTYDFAAAFEASENPGNKNGSAANGQAFYGWENEDKIDSKRQDYKGYEWAEGSVLPQICNVWRRSDRINGNIKNGGLYCPNNREMAIDGVSEGSIVQIFYTSAINDDVKMLWAIGVTEEGPRATALIDGVEAVSGQTEIASGATITIKSVTPAENGTGYIVFRAIKGMVITKVVIKNPIIEAE